jgi:hypothetical protein
MKEILASHILILFFISLTIQAFYISFGYLKIGSLLELITFNAPHNDRTIAFYCYFEQDQIYMNRLKFFLEVGVKETDPIDYVFIIQGEKTNVTFPNYTNIRIVKRPNDCYDFGAYGDTIPRIGGLEEIKKYKAVMFINPSSSGPILPKYWPKSIHWSNVFTSRLKDGIHAVSTSVSCPPNNVNQVRGFGPHSESFAIAITPHALELGLKNDVFSCKNGHRHAIRTGETLLSRILIANKLNLENLLLKYEEKTDWTNTLNWACNDYIHPTVSRYYNSDDQKGMTIDVYPLEVIFHKTYWKEERNFVYFNETLIYMDWALNRKNFSAN